MAAAGVASLATTYIIQITAVQANLPELGLVTL